MPLAGIIIKIPLKFNFQKLKKAGKACLLKLILLKLVLALHHFLQSFLKICVSSKRHR